MKAVTRPLLVCLLQKGGTPSHKTDVKHPALKSSLNHICFTFSLGFYLLYVLHYSLVFMFSVRAAFPHS